MKKAVRVQVINSVNTQPNGAQPMRQSRRVNSDTVLEMYRRPDGAYGVLLNGKLFANVTDLGLFHTGVRKPGWEVVPREPHSPKARKRFATPQGAVKSYFGRKAVAFTPPETK